MQPANQDDKHALLECYLTEYREIRSEILTRLELGHRAFNLMLVILTATITTIGYLATNNLPDLLSLLTLVFPIVACPIAFTFFDNEFMIYAGAFYMSRSIKSRLDQLSGAPTLMYEYERFDYLGKFTTNVQKALTVGRWFLFTFPPIMAVVYACLYPLDYWSKFVWITVIVIDSILIALNIASMVAAAWEGVRLNRSNLSIFSKT